MTNIKTNHHKTQEYFAGIREGITKYAHWMAGVQYVGTTGKSLFTAIEEVNREEAAQIGQITKCLE